MKIILWHHSMANFAKENENSSKASDTSKATHSTAGLRAVNYSSHLLVIITTAVQRPPPTRAVRGFVIELVVQSLFWRRELRGEGVRLQEKDQQPRKRQRRRIR